MRLLRVRAGNAREALRQARSRFGPEALVVEVFRKGEGVELLVAAERDDGFTGAPECRPAVHSSPAPAGIASLPERSEDPLARTLRIRLERAGFISSVSRALSAGAAGRFDTLVALRDAAERRALTTDLFRSGGPVLLVGARRSGKTTAAAMIAARAALGDRRPVAIIEAGGDGRPHPLLAACARLLGAPHTVARTHEEAVRAASRTEGRLPLIDLRSCRPLKTGGPDELRRLAAALPGSRIVLVAGADDPLLLQTQIRWLGRGALSAVGLTRTDHPEAALGASLSALMECGAASAFFTTGTEIPQGLVPATPETMARLVLRSIAAEGSPGARKNGGTQAAKETVYA